MKRRTFWQFASAVMLSLVAVAVTADDSVTLQRLLDYPEEVKTLSQENVPLLVAVVSQDCHYCAALKDDFLKPLLRNKAYAERVRIRQLAMDDGGELLAANGESISAAEQAAAWGVQAVEKLKHEKIYVRRVT